jgi:hypothetical protein
LRKNHLVPKRAIFLAAIAVVPTIVVLLMGIPALAANIVGTNGNDVLRGTIRGTTSTAGAGMTASSDWQATTR